MYGQIHRANIFVAANDYSVAVVTNVKVRFTHNSLNTQLQTLPQQERVAALAGRRLQYPGDYAMPDNARVEWLNDPDAPNATTLWNVVEDTTGTWHGPGGGNVVKTCQLEKIDTLF